MTTSSLALVAKVVFMRTAAATLLRGPALYMETLPGCLCTCSTMNSAALWPMKVVLGYPSMNALLLILDGSPLVGSLPRDSAVRFSGAKTPSQSKVPQAWVQALKRASVMVIG